MLRKKPYNDFRVPFSSCSPKLKKKKYDPFLNMIREVWEKKKIFLALKGN
jgi:hypothetical protein